MFLGRFERYDLLREKLFVLLVPTVFVGFFFFVVIEKHFDFLQILSTKYELRRKMSKRLFLFVTWVENSSPVRCGLVVTI